jgi:pimeloyl-ACP methyl ester carboxylesterase
LHRSVDGRVAQADGRCRRAASLGGPGVADQTMERTKPAPLSALDVGSARLAYAEHGLGAPVVLVHGSLKRLPPQRLEVARCSLIPAEILGSGFAPLSEPQVRPVSAPTLLMTGAQSPRLFHQLTDGLREMMPATTRTTIARASHIVHEDNPVDWLAAVLPFLAQHTPLQRRRPRPVTGALARMHH